MQKRLAVDITGIIGATPIFIVLSACQPTPALVANSEVGTSEEAANVFVSAYPAVPWADIADKLAPNNNLTIDQARTMAAQTTQVQVEQFLSTFAAGLGLGLPGTTSSITTTMGANGVSQTTGTRTTSSGTIPSSPTPSLALPSGAPAPDLTKGPVATGVDGGTILTAGTALYQQAQILDNQISKQVLPDGYQVHLITFQVNLQPKRRDLSYDAFTDVTLFPASWDEALATSEPLERDATASPPVKLYPLIIADALETTNVGHSIQSLRQAAFQLSGVVGGVGAAGALGGGSDKANSIVGLDKNSLVTVGRVSENTFRIRLGAENSGSSGLALVPRSYNISVVVLTRWDPANPRNRVTRLSAVTHTTIVSPDGTALASERRRDDLANKVAGTVRSFGYSVGGVCAPPARQPAAGQTAADVKKEQDIATNLNLLRALDRSDYAAVASCLNVASPLALPDELAIQRLLAALEELQIDARYSTLLIELRIPSDPTLPDPNQLVLLADDQKNTATAVLRGGKGLDAKKLQAGLWLKGKTSKLLPTALTMVGDGSEVDISFPSLNSVDLAGAGKLEDRPLFFAIADKTRDDRIIDGKNPDGKTSAAYRIHVVQAEASKAANPVSTSQTVVVADDAGSGRVTLQVGALAKNSTAKGLHLVVTGADVRADSSIGAAPLSTKFKGIDISQNTNVTLALGNLTPGIPVTVSTVDDSKKPIGDPIVFSVDRSTAGFAAAK